MRISRISLSVLATIVLFSCSKVELVDKQIIPQLDLSSGKSPLHANEANAKYIPGEYIVVFHDDADVDLEVERSERANGFKAKYKYQHALKGFSATLPVQALRGLRENPKVKYIEQDQEVYTIATVQSSTPSWGIDRIDSRSLTLDKKYIYTATGQGVVVYIIDTGIRFDHQEFGGRAVFGFDAFGGKGTDGNGHGTHVAGTVGGRNVGVAKNVKLVAVRVLNNSGSGTNSGVIAGVDFCANDHIKSNNIAVANMSLGGGGSLALDEAVSNAISKGIVMCVAAGNSSADVKDYSPARVPAAITVAASTSTDALASYSNYGSLVDIIAPSSSIYSSWKNNSKSYNTISGTSMASPHVAGVVALYMQNS